MIVNSKARQSSRENIKKSLYEVLLCCMGIVIYEKTDLQEKFKTRLLGLLAPIIWAEERRHAGHPPAGNNQTANHTLRAGLITYAL